MGKYKYSGDEKRVNKVLKMNQDCSEGLLNDSEMDKTRNSADDAIASARQLLDSLGLSKELNVIPSAQNEKLVVTHRDYEEIANEADELYDMVELEDILSTAEIENALNDLDRIEREFSQMTSISNKQDIAFLSIATALQTAKAIITPLIAEKLGYGKGFDPNERKAHDDTEIKKKHDQANRKFRDKYAERYGNAYWIEMLFQSVPYDAIKGSKDLGLGLNGNNHRLRTLGHDAILGWLFGTSNILTDTISLSDFRTYRVQRKPQLKITSELVLPQDLFIDTVEMIKNHKMNLPAALFAQAQHLISDVNTKRGLPIPLLSSINENFASKLYDEHYDALCLARDTKIVTASATVSVLINLIIGLLHGFGYDPKLGISRDLYEVRTRKILLISNSIASTSNIIFAAVTKNPKNLDIGGLLVTLSRLFSDIGFISRVKHEYINSVLDKQLKEQIDELNRIEKRLTT